MQGEPYDRIDRYGKNERGDKEKGYSYTSITHSSCA